MITFEQIQIILALPIIYLDGWLFSGIIVKYIERRREKNK